MRSRFIFRIRLIACVVGLVGIALLVQLWSLQIVHGDEYRLKAEGQYAIESSQHFDRGRIFFTPKEGPLIAAATLDEGFTIALIPNNLPDPAISYEALSRYLTVDSADYLAKAAKTNDPYEVLVRRVPSEVGEAIRAARIPGIGVYRERWRLYPGEEAAAQTIGFLGYGSAQELSGQYGLERFYDTVLEKPDAGLYVNFFADIFLGLRSRALSSDERPGADVVTSLEPSVQTFLEELLRQYQRDWSPEEVGAIILRPQSGEIVALATLPSFDPNDLKTVDAEAFSNRLVERVYEFGSIVKPLTVAAGIDAGVITPASTYNDLGYRTFDGSRIGNFDGKGRGVVSMQEVLSQSLNTGVAHIVEKLGTGTFRDYFSAYGLREETGIDLPSEAEPLTANLDSPRTIEYVTASFGQGFAVSPIAMARALASLANEGSLPSPHVAVSLRYPGGETKKLGWAPERRAISKESAEATTEMLVKVVDTALKGGVVKVPELSIAAKTGTAQIARQGERGYDEERFLHSFFGYFPAYDAEFLVFLYAVAPQGARYSSETWTDPFMESVRFLVSYYDIPPDRAPADQRDSR